jgi:hypothetical protein
VSGRAINDLPLLPDATYFHQRRTIMRPLLLSVLLLMPCACWSADAQRLSFLEQEVRNLQRQVQSLSRQLDELRTRPDRLAASPASPAGAPFTTSDSWIEAAKWRRVKAGMSELEVIELLGPPTSMRAEEGGRVLLYAKELGSSGFLGGSVRLRERAVVEVRAPTLQ